MPTSMIPSVPDASSVALLRAFGQRLRRPLGWMLLTLLLAGAVGCAEDFDPASLIARTRVLGARVEVEGVPSRATPSPGETATVSWLVTSPGATPALGWAFALCARDPLGGLGCGGAPLATAQGNTSPPRMSWVAPALKDGETGARLTVYGHICVGANATVNAQGLPTGCEGDVPTGQPGATASAETAEKETAVSLSVRVADLAHANANPNAGRGLTLAGEPWLASDDPCREGPRVAAGTTEHLIALVTAAEDRETATVMLGDPPVPTLVRETLQISSFATAGKLKSSFLFIEGDEPAAPSTTAGPISWDAPALKELPNGAETTVAFTFVVRDGRGGLDWTTRSACVTP